MRTIYSSINFTEEYFVIQLTINNNSLKDIAINNTISGLYIATRSKDSVPICGQFILERADFDYQNTKAEVLPLDKISNPNVKELLLIAGWKKSSIFGLWSNSYNPYFALNLQNIYTTEELPEVAICAKIAQVRQEGKGA